MVQPITTQPIAPDNAVVTTHINLLQSIVARLSNNSMSTKTWCLTLVTGLLGLAGAVRNAEIVHSILAPIIIFGFLDLRYLAHEKAYRNSYNAIVGKIRAGTYGLHDSYEANASITFGVVLRAARSWAWWPFYVGLPATYVGAHSLGWLAILGLPVKGP